MSNRMKWAAVAILGLGIAVVGLRPGGGTAQQPAASTNAGPKYTIVDTEGTNLLVVDNASNTLFFYTVDPDKDVGDELRLRGTVDLNQVGEAVITPKRAQ